MNGSGSTTRTLPTTRTLALLIAQHWSSIAALLLAALAAPLLVLLPLRLAILAVGGAFALVLTLRDPVWALYAAVLSVPLQDLILLPGGLSVTQAVLLLAAGAWGVRVLAYPEQPVLFGRLAVGLVVLLWALLLAALASPYSQSEGIKEVVRWASVLLIYLLALNTLLPVAGTSAAFFTSWRAVGLVLCLLLAPAANALFGLWQFVTASAPAGFLIVGGRFARAYGTIGQPNSFAGYINMAWPLAVALVAGVVVREYRLWDAARKHALPRIPPPTTLAGYGAAVGVAGLLVAALGASFSRGGWVGALGGGLALLAAALLVGGPLVRRWLWLWMGAGMLVAVLVGLVGSSGLLPETLTERVGSIITSVRLFDVRTVQPKPENFSVVERMAQLQSAWAMVRDHPLTGVGPGSYTLAYEGRAFPLQAQPYAFHPWYFSRGHAHNYYLQISAEAGLVGLLAYLLLLGLLVVQAVATLRTVQRMPGWFWHSVAAGGCGIIATVAIHNLLENLHVLNMGVQLGALWGLLAAVELHGKRTLKENCKV